MLCPHCIYVFCIYLRINSDLCHLQHKLIGFYNRDEKCLLCGTDWVFKYSGLRFVFKGLTQSDSSKSDPHFSNRVGYYRSVWPFSYYVYCAVPFSRNANVFAAPCVVSNPLVCLNAKISNRPSVLCACIMYDPEFNRYYKVTLRLIIKWARWSLSCKLQLAFTVAQVRICMRLTHILRFTSDRLLWLEIQMIHTLCNNLYHNSAMCRTCTNNMRTCRKASKCTGRVSSPVSPYAEHNVFKIIRHHSFWNHAQVMINNFWSVYSVRFIFLFPVKQKAHTGRHIRGSKNNKEGVIHRKIQVG